MKYSPRDGRFFALIIGVALLFIGWRFDWLGMLYIAGVLGIFLAGLIIPGGLFPVYKAWMIGGLAIGWIVNRIILTIVFSLVIAPLATVRRLKGDNVIEMGEDNRKPSYWNPVEYKADKKGYLKQF